MTICKQIIFLLFPIIMYSQNFNQRYEYWSDEISYTIESNDTLNANNHLIKINIHNKSPKNIFLADFLISGGETLFFENSIEDPGLEYLLYMHKLKPEDNIIFIFDLDTLKLSNLIFRSKYNKYFNLDFSFAYLIGIDDKYIENENLRVEGNDVYINSGIAFFNMKRRYFICSTINIK